MIRLGIYNSVIRPGRADSAVVAAVAFLSAGGLFGLLLPIVLAVIAIYLIQILFAAIAVLSSLPALFLAVASIFPLALRLSGLGHFPRVIAGILFDIALSMPIALGAAPQLLALFRAGRFLGYANENLGMLGQRQVFGLRVFANLALLNDLALFGAGRRNSFDYFILMLSARNRTRISGGRSSVRCQTGDRDRDQQGRNHEYAKKFLHV